LRALVWISIAATRGAARLHPQAVEALFDTNFLYPSTLASDLLGDRECPFLVISRHRPADQGYPLCPRKQTCSASESMSATCHWRTSVSATSCNTSATRPHRISLPRMAPRTRIGVSTQASNSRAAISWGSRFGVADDSDNLGNIVSYLTLDGIDEAVDVGD
jgi:hypothetical protein